MTEEVQNSNTEEQKEFTPIEQKALEMGWRPKEEFGGDEDDFVDAKEFVRRQPLFDKISQQSHELKAVKRAMEALKHHYTTVKESEYERALAALKKERSQAVADGDGDKFNALDQEIKTIEEQVEEIKEVKDQPLVQEVHPELQAWINANKWYTEVGYMRAFAEDLGQKLYKQGVPPTEVLKQITQAVKKEFPSKFTNPNKQTAPNVENGAKGSKASSKGISASDLTDQERKIMKTLVQSGVITEEKYLADLQAVKQKA